MNLNNINQYKELRINLRLLTWLRVLAIIGQLSAVYFASHFLDIDLQTNILYIWVGIYALITTLTYYGLIVYL